MNEHHPIDANAELIAGDPQTAPAVVGLCRSHYRAATAIAACEPWEREVMRAAAQVGAERVGYRELVRRAREIVLRGELYAIRRNGYIITFGASLTAETGGYVVLRTRTDDTTTAAAAA